jgi:hypothetical protein
MMRWKPLASVSVAADSYSGAAANNGGAGYRYGDDRQRSIRPSQLDIVDASLNDGTNSSLGHALTSANMSPVLTTVM